MGVDFIKQDPIKTILDLWHFSCSLIQSVFTLHEKAKILHGDLKPPNVLWKGGIVWLVDFDHAQDIDQAVWRSGTNGFMAPELLNHNKKPCSTKSDAYSVGKIIVKALDTCGRPRLRHHPQRNLLDRLTEISGKLAEEDPETRWSLREALDAMKQ